MGVKLAALDGHIPIPRNSHSSKHNLVTFLENGSSAHSSKILLLTVLRSIGAKGPEFEQINHKAQLFDGQRQSKSPDLIILGSCLVSFAPIGAKYLCGNLLWFAAKRPITAKFDECDQKFLMDGKCRFDECDFPWNRDNTKF